MFNVQGVYSITLNHVLLYSNILYEGDNRIWWKWIHEQNKKIAF